MVLFSVILTALLHLPAQCLLQESFNILCVRLFQQKGVTCRALALTAMLLSDTAGLHEAVVTCTSLLPPAWSPPGFAVTPLSSAALSQPPCPSHWADCAENPGSSCASGCCAGKGGLARKFKPSLSPGSRQSCESDAFGWVPPMPWAVLVQGMTFGEPGGVAVTSAWAPRENIFPLGDW